MYGSSYTHVPRYTLDAQKRKQLQRSKGKSCGYYMRIIFFFSSLIQSLIIVSLVLFLVYGKQQDSPSSGRIADLEQSFSRLSLDNQALKLRVKNLTTTLNVSVTERQQLDQDLGKMRNLSDVSYMFIQDLHSKLIQCLADKNKPQLFAVGTTFQRQLTNPGTTGSDCQSKLAQLQASEKYLKSERNQTVLEHSINVEKLSKERDDLTLEAINLRNDKFVLETQIKSYKSRCQQDFLGSLSGISNVTRAFLGKIDTLFPNHISFQLSCEKQRVNLEQIRNNCTSLSHQVEEKFQRYLDALGRQVSNSLNQITSLEASNMRVKKDHESCELSKVRLAQEHRRKTQIAQTRCDESTNNLLTEKKKLSGKKELLDSQINVQEKTIAHLKDQNAQLNSSCSSRVHNPYSLGLSRGGSSSVNQPNSGSRFSADRYTGSIGSRLDTGSLSLNKPATNGMNGSPNEGLTGSTGTDAGKRPAFQSISYGTGLGNTKLGSIGQGSMGVGIDRLPGGTSSLGNNGPATGLGSSSGTTGLGKPAMGSSGGRVQGALGAGGLGTGLGKLGPGSMGGGLGNTGYGNTGYVNTGPGAGNLGRGTGSAGGYRGLGGTQAGGGSAPVNLQQHLQELERLRRPSTTEKKNESPRTLG